jgi:hypothetical protein
MNAGGFSTTEQIWWSTVCILLAPFALTSVCLARSHEVPAVSSDTFATLGLVR